MWAPDDEEQKDKLINEKGTILVNKHGREIKSGYDQIKAAYCFYSAIQGNNLERQVLVYKSMLARASKLGFDVFNMVEVCSNRKIAEDLMFKPGSGRLAHYLYNWRIP